MRCDCFHRNVTDLVPANEDAAGEDEEFMARTAFENRFCGNFDGPIIAFGAEVTCKPSNEKHLKKMHTLGPNVANGMLVGYVQRSGGVWSGDLLIVDWQTFKNATQARDVYVQRIKAGQVAPKMKDGKFIFPVAAGTLQQPAPRSIKTTDAFILDSRTRFQHPTTTEFPNLPGVSQTQQEPGVHNPSMMKCQS